jgi:hypothetical protein
MSKEWAAYKADANTVWVDLDATICAYKKWEGIYQIGKPIDGAVEFMKELSAVCKKQGVRLGIFTVRTKADMPGRLEVLERNQWVKTEAELTDCLVNIVGSHLADHGIPGKPAGVCYIDDRGVECAPQIHGQVAYDIALRLVRVAFTREQWDKEAKLKEKKDETPGPGASGG